MSASQVKALRSVAGPIAASHDCDLEDVVIRQAGKRRLVRVVVDHSSGALTLDLVAAISRDISQVLDDSTIFGSSAYVLEVTSPGVDRPLREPRHWQRAIGRIVRVTEKSGASVEGRLTDAGQAEATLDVDGELVTVVLAEVARATVQVEFTRVEDVDLEGIETEAGEDDAADADPADEYSDTLEEG